MNIKVCLPEKKRWSLKENALAQAFTLNAEYGLLKAHCTGFYTQCGAWVAQRSLHRLLHSMRSMAKMGLSTTVQRLLHSVHAFFRKLPHARTFALKTGCSKRWKGCKLIEEMDIDLYAVKKIAHPRLHAYSNRNYMMVLHKAQNVKYSKVILWISYKWSHGDFDYRHSTCDQSSSLPGNVVNSTLLQISQWQNLDRKTMEGASPFFQGTSFLYQDP